MAAAPSASTAQYYNHYNGFPSSKNYSYCVASLHSLATTCNFNYYAAAKQPKNVGLGVVGRINSTNGEGSAATATDELEVVEVPKGPPSLISPLNVEKALRGIAITDADHYGRLGLQNGCSYDQVNAAYKKKVDEVIDRGLAEEELSKELELLNESHSILSSVEERRLYDWSLARKGKPDRYAWPFEVDITQVPFEGTPPPQEPEDEEPTRLVGYFMLSWFILSLTLLIVFNR